MCIRGSLSALTVVFLAGPVLEAEARPFRTSQVPNVVNGCGTCHVSSSGAGPRNAFGQDVEDGLTEPQSLAAVDWPRLAPVDSDGDGCSNGAELGDPEGRWQVGDPGTDGPISNPGDPEDSVCPEDGSSSPDPTGEEEGGCQGGASGGALLPLLFLALWLGRIRLGRSLNMFRPNQCPPG